MYNYALCIYLDGGINQLITWGPILYPLAICDSVLLEIAIEIVDLPIQNWDLPELCNITRLANVGQKMP